MKEKPDYANWVPAKLLVLSGGTGGAFAILAILCHLFGGGAFFTLAGAIFALLAVVCFAFCGYMSYARKLLAYDGGVQDNVLEDVLERLAWDGRGKLLDIGCGSGAMVIKAAKRFPEAWITGIDYWGFGWDYSQQLCENNARIENVDNRVLFQKGDAANLDFPDSSFDAAVSNMVFHEVRSQPDKVALITEALRVVKPGGGFSFSDIFFAKSCYKDIDYLIAELSKQVQEIHFIDPRRDETIPKWLRTPMVLGNRGLIYGRK